MFKVWKTGVFIHTWRVTNTESSQVTYTGQTVVKTLYIYIYRLLGVFIAARAFLPLWWAGATLAAVHGLPIVVQLGAEHGLQGTHTQ